MDGFQNDNGASGGIPLGLSMGMAMREKAFANYAGMTEAEKEKVISEARDAKSKKEMERIINSLDPGVSGDIGEMLEDTNF